MGATNPVMRTACSIMPSFAEGSAQSKWRGHRAGAKALRHCQPCHIAQGPACWWTLKMDTSSVSGSALMRCCCACRASMCSLKVSRVRLPATTSERMLSAVTALFLTIRSLQFEGSRSQQQHQPPCLPFLQPQDATTALPAHAAMPGCSLQGGIRASVLLRGHLLTAVTSLMPSLYVYQIPRVQFCFSMPVKQ